MPSLELGPAHAGGAAPTMPELSIGKSGTPLVTFKVISVPSGSVRVGIRPANHWKEYPSCKQRFPMDNTVGELRITRAVVGLSEP